MPNMFTFESLDDMRRWMAAQTARAQHAMTEEQRALTWGSYVMMPTRDFIIFGYVFTEEEVRLGELAAGADQEEAEGTLRALRGTLDRGYLYGRWHSLAEPEGELGSNHAVSCWPILWREFNVAATFAWDASALVRQPEGEWLLDKFIDFAQKRDPDVSTPEG